jgi:uncharacterized membrane protein
MNRSPRHLPALLLLLATAYCLASLAHFVHNAEFLRDYPNLPPWLSRSKVYLSWLGITAIGVIGICFARTRFAIIGLLLIGVYAALGFDGLGHYALAPVSAHTLTMNATIWSEVAAAALLLLATLIYLLRQIRHGSMLPRVA